MSSSYVSHAGDVGAVEENYGFKVGDPVVYFSHGVGQITGMERITRGGSTSMLYVISFMQDKMVLRVPVNSSSIRPICSREIINRALDVIQQKSHKNSMLWCKKMAIYEGKVNSGDPLALAEVIRDIYRNIQTAGYSYTERAVFENAMKRISAELAFIENISCEEASSRIKGMLEAAA